jgi:hypothetical protein
MRSTEIFTMNRKAALLARRSSAECDEAAQSDLTRARSAPTEQKKNKIRKAAATPFAFIFIFNNQ